jgi:type I restriction enzyme R subunit
VAALPKGIRDNRDAAAETIENNVRRLIIDEQPLNPKYYDKMSELLDALIAQRKKEALNYQKYLERIIDLAKKVANPASGESYPKDLDTPGKRALYDNLGKDHALALSVDQAVRSSRQDDWRNNLFKVKKVRLAVKKMLNNDEDLTAKTLELIKNQDEY